MGSYPTRRIGAETGQPLSVDDHPRFRERYVAQRRRGHARLGVGVKDGTLQRSYDASAHYKEDDFWLIVTSVGGSLSSGEALVVVEWNGGFN